jgi:hypothetical protein
MKRIFFVILLLISVFVLFSKSAQAGDCLGVYKCAGWALDGICNQTVVDARVCNGSTEVACYETENPPCDPFCTVSDCMWTTAPGEPTPTPGGGGGGGGCTTTAPINLAVNWNYSDDQINVTWWPGGNGTRQLLKASDNPEAITNNCSEGYACVINELNLPTSQTAYQANKINFTVGNIYWFKVINFAPDSCSKSMTISSTYTVPTPTPTPTLFPCTSGFNVSCAGSGAQATISWNSIAAAVGYVLRLNHEPYDAPANWYNATQGDQWQEPVSSTINVAITPGANYQYDVQGKAPGESYPYAGGRCPFTIFSCPAPTPTSTPTPTMTPTPTATPTPAQVPWIKLKNTSFISKNSLTSKIPYFPVAYDGDDTTQPYFIVGMAGVVGAPVTQTASPTRASPTSGSSSSSSASRGTA